MVTEVRGVGKEITIKEDQVGLAKDSTLQLLTKPQKITLSYPLTEEPTEPYLKACSADPTFDSTYGFKSSSSSQVSIIYIPQSFDIREFGALVMNFDSYIPTASSTTNYYIIYVARTDSSNYAYIVLQYDYDASTAKLKVYNVSGGTATEKASYSFTADAWHTFELRFSFYTYLYVTTYIDGSYQGVAALDPFNNFGIKLNALDKTATDTTGFKNLTIEYIK